MTLFVDLREIPGGGSVASDATLWDGGDVAVSAADFAERLNGRHVLFATHGFNVGRQAGIDALTRWEACCQFRLPTVFVGVLWPGDSHFLPIVDYPVEGEEAILSGRLLANFLNSSNIGATSLSFASHSLGARVVLEAISNLTRGVRCMVLMAAAIEQDCFSDEYSSAIKKVNRIHVVSSFEDAVLQMAFPVGNLVGEIIMSGHPYFDVALGRAGPLLPLPNDQACEPWRVPDAWDYGHLDYLPGADLKSQFVPPILEPVETTPAPDNLAVPEWKPAWSAAVVSTALD